MRIGVMRELEPGADIAGRVDSPIGGSQFPVHHDQSVADFHTCLLKVQFFNVRTPPCGDQDLSGGDAGPVGVQHGPVVARGYVRDEGSEVKCHTVGFKRGSQYASGVSRLTRQYPVCQFEQVHVHSETGHRLSHLATDGPGPEYRQPSGRLHQIEYRFVGEGFAGSQSRYWRHRGPCARRNHEPPGTEPMLPYCNALTVQKLRRAKEYVHAVAAVAFH